MCHGVRLLQLTFLVLRGRPGRLASAVRGPGETVGVGAGFDEVPAEGEASRASW